MTWVLAATGAAVLIAAVIFRRIVAVEMLKLSANRFLHLVLGVILIGIPVYTELWLAATEGGASKGYRALSSFTIYPEALRFGLQIAGYAVVIFSALSFAGEFDRRTIKNLLTCPVTRTELFGGKCAAQLLLALGLCLLVVCESATWACLRGEVHHIWRPDVYEIYPTFQQMMGHALRATALIVLPMLATAFLGLAASTLTESSGYAVAAGLIGFLGLTIGSRLLRGGVQYALFTFYPDYGLHVLARFSVGDSGIHWDTSIFDRGRYALAPLLTCLGLGGLAYAVFRFRNVTT